MKEMKYIVVSEELETEIKETIFIFDKMYNHNDFYDMICRIKVGTRFYWRRVDFTVVGAGFTDGHVCYGESITLGVKSRGDADTFLLG